MQNLNNDYTFWFAFMAMFNTSIGLSNVERNKTQEKQNQEILDKLNLILDRINGK